jgi:hypothetical protein
VIKRSILIFQLFVIPVALLSADPASGGPVPAAVQSADPADRAAGLRLAAGLQAEGGLVLSRSNGWPLKLQADGALGLDLDLLLPCSLALGIGLGLHRTLASGLSGGVSYRGYSGIEGKIHLAWSVPLRFLESRPALRAGLLAGILGRLDRYAHTTLYFPYPGLYGAPFLELGPPGPSRLRYRILLPAELYFRRDMDVSTSVGLGFELRWYTGGAPSAR